MIEVHVYEKWKGIPCLTPYKIYFKSVFMFLCWTYWWHFGYMPWNKARLCAWRSLDKWIWLTLIGKVLAKCLNYTSANRGSCVGLRLEIFAPETLGITIWDTGSNIFGLLPSKLSLPPKNGLNLKGLRKKRKGERIDVKEQRKLTRCVQGRGQK